MRIADTASLLESFLRQEASCTGMGAPFTARLCHLLGTRLDDGTSVGRRVLQWPSSTLGPDLVPLRCCAALNAKVRAGEAADLARHYPPHTAGDDETFWQAIAATVARHDAWMTRFLDSAPQTNEVARSGVLLAGFLAIARATGMPLDLHEMGASAGLNLIFDRYAYDLGGGRTWGSAEAPVRIPCLWTGETAPALSTAVSVIRRRAVDLRPLAASSREDRERLLAYIWPEQTERVARIEAALSTLAGSGIAVEQGDALAWAEARLAEPQDAGTCRVFYHSVFMQYLPKDLQQVLRERLRQAGAAATAQKPFAWLAMEGAADNPHVCYLSLSIWPGGTRQTLAQVDWHGKNARFLELG